MEETKRSSEEVEKSWSSGELEEEGGRRRGGPARPGWSRHPRRESFGVNHHCKGLVVGSPRARVGVTIHQDLGRKDRQFLSWSLTGLGFGPLGGDKS